MSKLAELAGVGKEQITDTVTPYLKVAQKGSDEVNKNKPVFIQGLEVGQFFCGNAVYGSTIEVVVVGARKHYAIVDDDNQFKGFSDTIDASWGRDVKGQLRTREGYRAVLNYSYAVVEVNNLAKATANGEEPIVMIFTLKTTNVGVARKWNTMMQDLKLEDGVTSSPIFGGVWKLTTVYKENDKGDWYGFDEGSVTFARYVDDSVVDALMAATTKQKQLTAAANTHQVVAQITDDSDIR